MMHAKCLARWLAKCMMESCTIYIMLIPMMLFPLHQCLCGENKRNKHPHLPTRLFFFSPDSQAGLSLHMCKTNLYLQFTFK